MDNATESAGIRARLKQLSGENLSPRELKSIERWQKESIDESRDSILSAIPKGIYCKLAGRQQKVVDEFGARYDIPVDVPVINLHAVIDALHTRVSELAKAARPNLDADEEELVKEKLRQEIGKLQRQSTQIQLVIDESQKRIVAVSDVRTGLEWLTAKLREMGVRLHRDCGQPGLDAVNELLETMAVELESGALKF